MRMSPVLVALSVALGATGCASFFAEPGSALAEAAHRGDIATMRSLVAAGADPNAYDPTGQTPLHWAARGGHRFGPHHCRGEAADRPDVVAALIALGARPNVIDQRGSMPGQSSGWTPLHLALHHEQFATAMRLLELGADPNVRSRQGTSVMAMAADEGAPTELLQQMLAKGFDPRKARTPERP